MTEGTAAKEEGGAPAGKKARREPSPDWGEEDGTLSPSQNIRRSNSSAFMLDWVQPAVQQVHSASYLERIAKVGASLYERLQNSDISQAKFCYIAHFVCVCVFLMT
jgi:hypothetical protein